MTKKILIAEDNELNMKLMSDILSLKGYEITKVYDGEEALKEVATNDFDLMLLDIQMPKKDGYAVLAEIKKNFPIIIVSAYARQEEIDKVEHFNHVDYITKPIQVGTFLAKIEEILNK